MMGASNRRMETLIRFNAYSTSGGSRTMLYDLAIRIEHL